MSSDNDTPRLQTDTPLIMEPEELPTEMATSPQELDQSKPSLGVYKASDRTRSKADDGSRYPRKQFIKADKLR